jgi:hypothetical protein
VSEVEIPTRGKVQHSAIPQRLHPDPPLLAVSTAYSTPPLPPFLHPPVELIGLSEPHLLPRRAVVSVRYATIVPVTDADIARDNISREAYAAVAARRTQFDQLVWQVPVLSLTAQAFLFSIALSPDGTRTARIIASLLSLVMTFLSLHLMVKHRQGRARRQSMARGARERVSSTGWSSEMADAWSILGGLSQQHQSEHWLPWRLVETHWVPDLELGPLGVWDGSDRRSATGHLRAQVARILIARRPVPPLPHRARTSHQRAERVFANGVYGSVVHVVDHGLLVLVIVQEALEVVFLSGLG